MENQIRIFLLEDSYSRVILFREIFAHPSIYLDQAKTVEEGKKLFQGDYDLILLDHDLEDAHYSEVTEGKVPETFDGTGTEFAKWMASYHKPTQGPVVIHSYNPDGAKRMQDILVEAGWYVTRCPFGLTILDNCKRLVEEVLDASGRPLAGRRKRLGEVVDVQPLPQEESAPEEQLEAINEKGPTAEAIGP